MHPDTEPVLRSLAAACQTRVAYRSGGGEAARANRGSGSVNTRPRATYRTRGAKGGEEVHIHPSSVLHGLRMPAPAAAERDGSRKSAGNLAREQRRTAPECVIYNELVRTSKKYMRCVSGVQERWVKGARPELLLQHAREQGTERKRTKAELKELKRAKVLEIRRRELAAAAAAK